MKANSNMETEARSEIYHALLNSLRLSRQHQGNLIRRGLSLASIERNEYRTMPSWSNRSDSVEELVTAFGVEALAQTPGFFKKPDGVLSLAGQAGLLIPVRDLQHRIVALKVQGENLAEGSPKYTYISSKSRGGCGPGSPIHVPLLGPHESTLVRVTEGELKADAISERTGILTLSVAGVTRWRSVLPVLEAIGPADVTIAYDSDLTSNPAVHQALVRLVAALREHGYHAGLEVWEPILAKGLDDLLVAGYEPSHLFGDEMDAYIKDSAPVSSAVEPRPLPKPVKNNRGSSEEKEPELTPADLADEFLRSHKYLVENEMRFRSWRGNHYVWTGAAYAEMPLSDLNSAILSMAQDRDDLRTHARMQIVRDTIANITAMTFIRTDVTPPKILDDTEPGHFVSVRNGILAIDSNSESDVRVNLRPHSPNFFTLNTLPYAYDPAATCPTWDKFLEQMLPEQDVRDFLAEWFGYNLLPEIGYDKFVIFKGEGANGKTVVAKVLTEMLGPANVSSVGLEAFSSTKTIMIGHTFGKLANVVEEIDQVDKVSEGLLKNYVSGGTITVDRKFKDPFQFTPTARITLCTNILPRFADRSDGLWRRLIIIPFDVQILDEAKQDKRLKDPAFWRASGELPGVLNWALRGLSRLKQRGKFIEPKCSGRERESYKSDSNPAKVFLNEHCVADAMSWVSSRRLNDLYQAHCKTYGHPRPLSAPQFAAEVRRVFPDAQLSPHPVTCEDASEYCGMKFRSRVWYGIGILTPDVSGAVA